MRYAADIAVGTARNKGSSTAFALDAKKPALLRKGVLEALGGQLDFACDIWGHWGPMGDTGAPLADFLLRVHDMGHYVLSVMVFREGTPESRRDPKMLASLAEWARIGPSNVETQRRRDFLTSASQQAAAGSPERRSSFPLY